MSRKSRYERLALISKYLIEHPAQLISLGFFAEQLNAAKSTLSEDIALLKEIFASRGEGHIETVPGAAGGVCYRVSLPPSRIHASLEKIAAKLRDPARILPGGYLYMTDVVFSPRVASMLGKVFATLFADSGAEYVLTVETKGIPLALATAHSLNVPLLVARRDARVTEGSAVSINYVSGSTGSIRTMSLSRRAVGACGRVLLIDDFMRGGGTVKGMTDLLKEFDANVCGIGVLVESRDPKEKLISDYRALITLRDVEINKREIDLISNY